MTKTDQPMPRATRRPADQRAPAHWTKSDPPAPADGKHDDDPLGIDPVRYGDWERNGIAIDF